MARRLCCAALLLFSSIAAVADQGTDDFKFAQGLYQNERWSLAEEAFRKFLTAHPNHEQTPLATLYLGLSQIQTTKYAEARKTLTAFVTKNPQSRDVAHADYRIAECSYYLGEHEAAAESFDKALKKFPEDPFREFAWAYLGEAQRRLGRNREAVASLQKSLDLFPRGRMAGEARFSLAQATDALGETEKAITLYREVSADTANDRADQAQVALAALYFTRKEYDQSLTEYLNVEKRFPKSRQIPLARLNAGFAAYQKGDFAKALGLFDQAEEDAAQKLKAAYWKGLSLKALRDFSGAAAVLQEIVSAAGQDELLESILYQLADCRLKSGELLEAERKFLEVSDRFPRGLYGDQSLYFATDCILKQARTLNVAPQVARLRDAELLLERFDREYPSSKYGLHHDLQRGEFLLLRNAEGDVAKAEVVYRRVLEKSANDQTQRESRYQLARVKQLQKDNAAALTFIRPLAEEVMKTPTQGFPESLILFAALSRDTGAHSDAIKAAESYLKDNPSGALRDQAFGILAVSAASSGAWPVADQAVEKLLANHPGSPQLSQNLLLVANAADTAKQWDRAIRLYGVLLAPGRESPFHATAQIALAWCEFNKGDFAASETHFRDFIAQHATDEKVAEAGFMIGKSLESANQIEKATAAYQETFSKYKPAPRAFLAGLQASRLLVKQRKIADADQSYAALDAAFPKEQSRPQVLNEWAGVLADAEQFERADAVYSKLATDFPESELADNARFYLAESDLLNGRIDQAKASFEQLVASTKSDDEVRENSLYRLVVIAVEKEDWPTVIGQTNELAKRYPQSAALPELRLQEGNALLRQRQYVAAEKTLFEVSALSDKDGVAQAEWFPQVWPLLAEAQFLQKKYDDILKTAARMREWQPESALLYQVDEVVGRAFKQQARFDEARQAFQRVVDSKAGAKTQTAAKAQLMIAETYFDQEKYQPAREAYLRVFLLYEFPDWQAPALFQSGKCAELLKQPQEARKDYEILVEKFPESDYAKQAKDRLKGL